MSRTNITMPEGATIPTSIDKLEAMKAADRFDTSDEPTELEDQLRATLADLKPNDGSVIGPGDSEVAFTPKAMGDAVSDVINLAPRDGQTYDDVSRALVAASEQIIAKALAHEHAAMLALILNGNLSPQDIPPTDRDRLMDFIRRAADAVSSQ